MSSIYK